MASDRTVDFSVRAWFPSRGATGICRHSDAHERGSACACVRSPARVWTISAYVLLLAVAAAAAWRINRAPAPAHPIVPVRLIADPEERVLNSAVLSPSGKFLAYSDPAGISVYDIETCEIRRLPETRGLLVAGWPGRDRLQAFDASRKQWLSVPVESGGAGRRASSAISVAPDGSRFIAVRDGQYRVEGTRGQTSVTVLNAGKDTPVYFAWSPDSRLVAYARAVGVSSHPGSEYSARIHIFDPGTGRSWPLIPPLRNRMISGVVWLPDGRVIFAAATAVFAEAVLESNLWQVRVNPGTGRPEGNPVQLTNWSGFMIENLSSSADGKRLVYLGSQLQTDAYVAEIEDGGRRIHPPRRLTLDQRNDLPLDWMPDGKSVVFVSDRLGHLLAFRQRLERDLAEPLTGGRLMSGNPRVTADGKWILYIAAERGTRFGPLMRMPVSGGAAERVLESVTAEAQYRCSISGPCIFSDVDEERSERITWQFDPIAGKGRELFRTRADDGPPDISRDGRIAYLVHGRPRNRIRIVSIDGAEDVLLTVAGASNLSSLDWAADGRGLYTGDAVPGTAQLFYAGLDGEQRVLWKQTGSWQTWAVPSRDGKRIAILGMTRETDAWMIDGI
ncbi:MAG TPA: hypothetical protein VN428_24120 [Bryobacteraceae bacterium]|nr:hypothetical protein [Bryobacteraceae bacterium]